MRSLTGALAIAIMAILAVAAPAGAQDMQVGEMVADPATVPEAGEYEITATGSGMIPDTDVLLTACVSPADELVPGVSTEEEIVAAAEMLGLETCDIGAAQSISVDSDGNFTATVTITVGVNTFLTAGDIAQTQAATTWIPIVSAEPTQLAETGANTLPVVLAGFILIAVGGLAVRVSRRFGAV
jgi:hypothetical protein